MVAVTAGRIPERRRCDPLVADRGARRGADESADRAPARGERRAVPADLHRIPRGDGDRLRAAGPGDAAADDARPVQERARRPRGAAREGRDHRAPERHLLRRDRARPRRREVPHLVAALRRDRARGALRRRRSRSSPTRPCSTRPACSSRPTRRSRRSSSSGSSSTRSPPRTSPSNRLHVPAARPGHDVPVHALDFTLTLTVVVTLVSPPGAPGRLRSGSAPWVRAATSSEAATATADRRSARSSASRTASSTTGRAPTSCVRRCATRTAAARSACTRTRDLVELKVVKRLLDAGISLQSARKAIEYLRTQLGADLASAHLVIDGANTVLAQTDDQIVDLLRDGQGVLNVVALGPVVDDLATELHRYAPSALAAVGRRRTRRTRPPGRSARHRHRAAPARDGPLRAQLGAAVREAARLLRHRVGLRTANVHARVGSRRPTRAGVHARLLSARVRPLHRDHDAEPEARDQEEPQGPPAARAAPRGRDPRALPARLPASAREVRPRAAVAARRRRRARGRAAAAGSTCDRRPPDRNRPAPAAEAETA